MVSQGNTSTQTRGEDAIIEWNYIEFTRGNTTIASSLKQLGMSCEWHGIRLPFSFCIIDYMFVKKSSPSLIYGVQIARATDPSKKHDSHET